MFESEKRMYERVPDLTDYKDLWLSLQIFVTQRTRMLQSQTTDKELKNDVAQEAAHTIRAIATSLMKIFKGNNRWSAT